MARLLLAAFVALTACSGIRTLDLKDTPTLTLPDLKTQGAAVAERFTGKGGPIAVHLRAGEELPVRLHLEVPGLTLVPGNATLRFDRDLWVLFGPDGLSISPDGHRWAAMGDGPAIRELFGLGKGGSFQVGFGVTAQDGAFISAQARLNAAK